MTVDPDVAPDVDPSILERLRRSGIRIDREGRFIHEGEEVRHQGLRAALFRWLDRLPPPDGRYILRLDPQRYAYVDVDDTPLVARSARVDGDRALLVLSDGSEEGLDPGTLTLDPAGVLRCWVRDGRLEARLSTSAAAVLAERITEEQGQPALVLGRRRFPLPARPGS